MQTPIFFGNHVVRQTEGSQTAHANLVPLLIGSQTLYGESFGQLKPPSWGHANVVDQLPAVSRELNHVIDPRQGLENPDNGWNRIQKLTIFPGNVVHSNDNTCDTPNAFALALQEKVEALLLLSQQDERYVGEGS